MYERFTDRAIKVMRLANEEAQRFNHEYIGTEHILLGLVKDGSGAGANVLTNFGIDLRKIRLEVEKLMQSGPIMVTGKLPQTPRAKKTIEYAMEEACNLNHNYLGTEHILLGLLRERGLGSLGVAGQVLSGLGIKLEKAREEVVKLLTQYEAKPTIPETQKSKEIKTKKPEDSGIRAVCFAFTLNGLGIDKLNTFLKSSDPRLILDKLQSSSDGMVYITIFYQLQ